MTEQSAWRKWGVPFGVCGAIVLAAALNQPSTEDIARQAAEAPSSSVVAAPPVVASDASSASELPPAGNGVDQQQVTVVRVIDGDIFEVAGGDRVRVLGIDACELGTPGGTAALNWAQFSLTLPSNGPITVTREPGVDRDPYGRMLRYVQLGGADFGSWMITYPYVGVYEGHNDAAPQYVANLRSGETPRECGAPAPVAPSTTVQPDDDHDRTYVPAPPRRTESHDGEGRDRSAPTKPRTGQSGHPCVSGERDGDGDGFCGEGR